MKEQKLYGAVSGIIENEEGKILFLKRFKTGYMDGKYQLPSGHIDGEEVSSEALIREMKEEVGIDVDSKDIEFVHVFHKIRESDRIYFDIYAKIKKYSGEIINTEPHKCSELKFLDISDNDIVPSNKKILEKIKMGEFFTEEKGAL